MGLQVSQRTFGQDVLIDQNKVFSIKNQFVFRNIYTAPKLIDIVFNLSTYFGDQLQFLIGGRVFVLLADLAQQVDAVDKGGFAVRVTNTFADLFKSCLLTILSLS